jgi:hypothetical protein
MYGPIGFDHGFLGVFGAIVGFLGSLILFAIIVAVLFFLIRFLIVGTKAAQLYLDTHRVVARAAPVVEPVTPVVGPVATSPAAAPTPTTPAATPTPTTPTTAAPRKPRTPKTPPSPDR